MPHLPRGKFDRELSCSNFPSSSHLHLLPSFLPGRLLALSLCSLINSHLHFLFQILYFIEVREPHHLASLAHTPSRRKWLRIPVGISSKNTSCKLKKLDRHILQILRIQTIRSAKKKNDSYRFAFCFFFSSTFFSSGMTLTRSWWVVGRARIQAFTLSWR